MLIASSSRCKLTSPLESKPFSEFPLPSLSTCHVLAHSPLRSVPYSSGGYFCTYCSTASSYVASQLFHLYQIISHKLSHRLPYARSAARDCRTNRTRSTVRFVSLVLHVETQSRAALRLHDRFAINVQSGIEQSETHLLC